MCNILDDIFSLKNLFNMFENPLFFHTSKLFKHMVPAHESIGFSEFHAQIWIDLDL